MPSDGYLLKNTYANSLDATYEYGYRYIDIGIDINI